MSIYNELSGENVANLRLINQLEKAHQKPAERVKPKTHILSGQETESLDGLPIRHKLHYIRSLQDNE